MHGFVFPNEAEVQWSLLIVLYPFITGLVAGAFIVSALYHVFGRERLRPVAKLALLTALAFLLVAPMPLLLHLSQPARGLAIMWTPNPTSAMAGFGYIYAFYLLILVLEIWFSFRKDIVLAAQSNRGISRLGYTILSLGAWDISDRALAQDHRLTRTLAAIGIPAAAFLHGYVGFIFGAIKANAWWSTPLQPIIFLLSAVVSGMALLMLVYAGIMYYRRSVPDQGCLLALNRYLWYFLLIDFTLEVLEVFSKAYEAEEAWPALVHLLTSQISLSFFGLQLALGAVVPLVILALARQPRLGAAVSRGLTLVAAVLVLVGVFSMRWNVVVGGQLVSKSLRGFLEYTPTFFGREGVLVALAILALPFVVLAVLTRILNPWAEEVAAQEVEETPAAWQQQYGT